MHIFAIETSCDETAVAIVDVATRKVLAENVYSQFTEHAPYGGVVPELASRAHLERLPALAAQTLQQSGLAWADINAMAATTGPGLTPALLIGSTFAKILALALGKPFVPTNHIEAHALSPLLTDATLADAFFTRHQPYLLLLVSGGHCQLVTVTAVGRYTLLGTTLDDAVGECFDKVGKLLGLPHPAGPAVETLAHTGNPTAVTLPRPKNDATLDFSFAGLKTAVRDLLHSATPPATAQNKPDLAASFQHTVAATLSRKTSLALQQTQAQHLVVAGGVAANATIRAALQHVAAQHHATFTAPPLSLCTDNATMIAWCAGLRLQADFQPENPLATQVRPRWPLAEMSA